MPGRREGVR